MAEPTLALAGPDSRELFGSEALRRPYPLPWGLIGPLALGLVLGLFGVLTFAWEQDELYTVIEATTLWDSPLKPGIHARPLYYLIQHVFLPSGPATPIALRALPLAFGLLGIWITWLLASRIAGRTAGAVAATLTAISPWHLYVSGLARYYSLLYFLCGGFFLFLWASAHRPTRRVFLVALAFAVCGSITHPSFLVAAVGPVLGLLAIGDDGRFRPRLPPARALRWLWLPWAGIMLAAAAALKLSGQAQQVRNFGGRGTPALLRLVPAIVQWMTPVIWATGLLGALAALGKRDQPPLRRWGAMVLGGYVVTPALLFAAAYYTDVYADYAIGLLPLAHASCGVLVALAAAAAGERARYLAVGALVVIAAGVAPWTASHLADGTRFDYRSAIDLIERAGPREPVLAWPEITARQYGPNLDVRALRLDPKYLDGIRQDAPGGFWALLSVREYGVIGDDPVSAAGSAWIIGHCRRDLVHERTRFDSRRYRVELFHCPAT